MRSGVAGNRSITPLPLRPYFHAGEGCGRPLPIVAIRSSIFQDFECKALADFHTGCTKQSTHGLGGAALPPNYFTKVFGMNTQFQNSGLRTLDGPDLHFLWMVHESPGNGFHQLLHRAPRTRLSSTTYMSLGKGALTRKREHKTETEACLLRQLRYFLQTDEAAHCIAWLCADAEPILSAFRIQLDPRGLLPA